MSLAALGLSEAAADIRDGPLHLGGAGRRLPRGSTRSTATSQAWAFLDPEHAMRQAQAADDHRKRASRPARCMACRRHQGHLRHRRHADRVRLALWAGRTPRRDAAAVARLRAAGAVILGKTVTTEYAYFHPGKTQTRTTGAHAGRLVERLGGGGRAHDGAGRYRLADQRLGDPAGGVLRRGRLQADARADPAQRRAAAVARARPCRRVRAQRRGRRPAGRDAGRLRRGGSGHPRRSRVRRSSRPPQATRRCRRALPSCARRPGRRPSRSPRAFAELVDALGESAVEVELGDRVSNAPIDMHRIVMDVEMAHNLHRDYEQGGDALSAGCAR